MIAAWMAQALAVGVLLALAARGLDELFRLYRLPRRFVWAGAVGAAALLPVLALVPPQSPAPTSIAVPVDVSGAVSPEAGAVLPEAGAVADAAGSSAILFWVAATSARLSDAGAAGIAAASARVGSGTLDAWLAVVWLLLSALLLGVLGWTALRFARTRRDWRTQEIAGTRVYVTRGVGPAVVGVFRPAIIVPGWLLRTDGEQQRLVVLHEREHVRSGDHALLAGAAVLAALLPWNLPLHWLLRRLRLAIELDCDRRVLAAGAEPRAYGAMLIDIASRTHRLPVAAAALADPPTDLETRILAMTTKLPRFRPLRAGAAALCAAALVLVACDVDLLDPALRDATVGEVINTAVLADSGMAAIAAQARYFVDGDEVSLDEIRDLRVDAFANVSVVQPTASATGAAEVRMRTVAAHAAAQAAADRAMVSRDTLRRGTLTGVTIQRVTSQRDPLRAVTVTSARRPIGQPVTTGVVVRGETRAVRVVPQADVLRGRIVPQAGALRASRILPQAEGRRALRVVPQADALRAPLVVVDGIIVSAGAGLNINALDIESVEIIKGAAAAVLYGSRAANGVISITTKRH